MNLFFANPAGGWVLLGVPALVAIHFLQRKSRRVEVSTLFLLAKLQTESRAGRRIEQWRNSRLFWLQILAVLLLAWLLSEPRWTEPGTLQRVALVLDDSIAMRAFREATLKGLDRDTAALARGAARTEWLLAETDPSAPPLYRGEDRIAMMAALAHWNPSLGTHDAEPALRTARAVIGFDGLMYFVTSRPYFDGQPPGEARLLAYGKPLDNMGLAAASAEMHEGRPLWRVLVRNYSTGPQERSWWIESDGSRSEPKTINLAANETMALQGIFPEGKTHLVFTLQGDDFAPDDRAPLVLPKPKTLMIRVRGSDDFATAMQPVKRMIEPTLPAVADADLVLTLGHDYLPAGAPTQVFFSEVVDSTAPVVHAQTASQPETLMEGLNWNGLVYQASPAIPTLPTDTPLLWDGNKPLIFMRTEADGERTLVFNFDPRGSNIARLPAFAILMSRFAEEARRAKFAPESANFIAGERLEAALPLTILSANIVTQPMDGSAAATATFNGTTAPHATAPSPPAFFTLNVDGKPLLDAASQFPDPRQSDFRDAATIPLDIVAQTAREQTHSHPDALAPLWLLALLGALIASWREVGKTA